MKRVLEPEILDRLDAADPAAIRSRRDLRRINWLMGSECWILKQLALVRRYCRVDKVLELGAGEGKLLAKAKEHHPELACIGYELIDRPSDLPGSVEWRTGNFLEQLEAMPVGPNSVVVASLILHHLDETELARLGEAMRGVAALIAVEPDRSSLSLCLGELLLPIVSPVTRSDMMTSIRAGFSSGELSSLLAMSPVEESAWLGGRRVLLQ